MLIRRTLLAAVALCSTVAALATTIVVPTDQQLVAKSPLIVVAVVEQSEPVLRSGGIWTETVLRTERTLKGVVPAERITVREQGGQLDGRISVIFGAPAYRKGERVMAFLVPTPRGDYQTTDLFIGKFTHRTTVDGVDVWHRDNRREDTRLLDDRFSAASSTNVQRRAAAFERFVADQVAGGLSQIQYVIANPQFSRGIEASFTSIDEPNIYRWFVFDAGGSVAWRSFGQQSGYSGGGLTELQTAMNVWSGFAGSRINYRYTGPTTAAAGGLNRPNGINEVLFNDPLGEVSGSWDSSTGGVVGVGGFNQVGDGGAWRGPFAADATHTTAIYQASSILEGNLVIQDGVSSSRGISAFVLAEILAHEFGHTLGLGHSSDNGALMYYSVTGAGPSLRSDDQMAARWLYPLQATGGGPTAPAPPTGLSARVSDTTATLTWTDNAVNETSQNIYSSTGGGAYIRLGQVGANVTTFPATELDKGLTYNFRVTAANATGESAPSNAVTVTIQSDLPQAAFRMTPITGTAGATTFSFYDASTGPISSWSWTFGDGSSSDLQNATHRYTAAGTFAVQLTVRSSAGQSSTVTRPLVVTTSDSPLVASFSFSPNDPSVIDEIEFVDESTGPVQSWKWNLGDGATSTDQNPKHRYGSGGSYNVQLEVTGAGRTATTSKVVSVGGGGGGTGNVQADFEVSSSSPLAGESVQFTDTSTGGANSWYWDFGDGFSSTSQNPKHSFQKGGAFNVTVTAGNLTSSSSRTRAITVVDPANLSRTLVAVAAETVGGNGSNWKTELSLFNRSTFAARVTATYIPVTGGLSAAKTFTVAPGATVTFGNALNELFSLREGAGGIAIDATGTSGVPELRISSRTFTTSAVGTYGQFVGEVAGVKSARTTYIAGLQSNASYRTNIGLVNASTIDDRVELRLSRSDGTPLGTTAITLPKRSFQQSALAAFFPTLHAESGALLLRVVAQQPDSVFAYGSIVDNRTQDPIYVPSAAPASTNSMVIPVVVRAAGFSNTFWRSDLTIANTTAIASSVSLTFLESGVDNRAAAAKVVTIPASGVLTIADAMSFLGVGDKSGSLELAWSNGAPVVTSRTYTERVSDGGSFGQSIDPVRSFSARSIVTGLRSDASYRTNLGFVNSSSSSVTARVALLNGAGVELASSSISLKPRSQQQQALAQIFSGLDVSSLGVFTVVAESSDGTLFAYGSVIDNVSGDPIFIAGR